MAVSGLLAGVQTMADPSDSAPPSRISEWFVPRFGPLRFRTFVGLLFLPYTGMVLSFAMIGSLLAETVSYERLLAIVVVYFFGLGIAAHALDALGSKGAKPWGAVFTRRQLWLIAVLALAVAYGIAIYYMLRFVPALWVVAILEGFFVFAYNLEWFSGRFHGDGWFAVSWGALPVVAGFVMQTNGVSLAALVVALSMGLFASIEIKASRPYKELKRRGAPLAGEEQVLLRRYETLLKCVSLGVLLLGAGLLLARVAH
jgi:hypothetical protein